MEWPAHDSRSPLMRLAWWSWYLAMGGVLMAAGTIGYRNKPDEWYWALLIFGLGAWFILGAVDRAFLAGRLSRIEDGIAGFFKGLVVVALWIAIPLGLLYLLVRFIKWAWTN